VRECVVPEALAARVPAAAEPLAAYRATNVDGALNAAAARRASARRIVFV
jgi:nucleoside-diphosphate-sugar epimerase